MNNPPVEFKRVPYESLNSRQKENYNFQKVSAVLAEYGFVTLRLSDDWQGADFIAHHVNGHWFLKVQLKSRLIADTKYKSKDIWICFNYQEVWYLYPHDDFLRWALEKLNIGNTKGWENPNDWAKVQGAYSWRHPPNRILSWLSEHALTNDPTGPVQEAARSRSSSLRRFSDACQRQIPGH